MQPTIHHTIPAATASGSDIRRNPLIVLAERSHRLMLAVSCLLCLAGNAMGQTQLGADIDGETASNNSGTSVALSSNGSRLATGAPLNDGSATDAGHVRVYEWSGAAWVQLGSDIDGEAAGDNSGNSVSISSNGSRVAIGAGLNDGTDSNAGHVRVYEWSGAAWVQLGSDIDGEAASDRSGNAVSLSSDGSRVAIGAINNDGTASNAGHVRVYEWSGAAWVQLGGDIDGEAAGDNSGSSVSLSSDGSRVAIGAPANSGTATGAGHVRVYQWSGAAWVKLGSDIDGEALTDQSGTSVALSSDGSRVAIGAVNNDGAGTDAGHVRVYEWSGAAWVQLGSDINGEAASDRSGTSISLSSDGSRVAIGAINNDGTGTDAGHVRVYEWSGVSWVQLGSDIDGEAASDNSGNSVSLSSNGSRVAIGARFNDGNGLNSGQVRVYQVSDETAPADYTVTTTATAITVTDVAGNGDLLTVDVTAADIAFGAAGRTFSVNAGPNLPGSSGALSLSGITSITVDAALGSDIIRLNSTGSVTLPNVTLNGGEGDDELRFGGAIDFASLDADLQNDAAMPGVDRVTTLASAIVASSTGSITIRCSRDISLGNSVIRTHDGALVIEANQQAPPTTGIFVGISSSGGLIEATGTGAVTVKGRGGDAPSAHGVILNTGGDIVGGTGAPLTVDGSGGASGVAGVTVEGTGCTISSHGANVVVVGVGGEISTSSAGRGVHVLSGGVISAGGSGNVDVTGTGSPSTSNSCQGVRVTGAGSMISAPGGVRVEGHGAGSGSSNDGIEVSAGAVIESPGAVTLVGESGDGAGDVHDGVRIVDANSVVRATGSGALEITGMGGDAIGSVSIVSSIGVLVRGGGRIESTGGGSITLHGSSAATTQGGSYGCIIDQSFVTSAGGPIGITGVGGNAPGEATTVGSLGILLRNNSQIATTGGGMVALQGTGAMASVGSSEGLRVGASLVTSVDGPISLEGAAATGAVGALGVFVQGDVIASGAGPITVTGAGAMVTSSGSAYGVYVAADAGSGGVVRTNDGNIEITGTGGSGTTSNAGFKLASVETGRVETLGSGSVTIRSDGINIDPVNGTIAAGNNAVTIKQLTDGTAIDFGSTLGPMTSSKIKNDHGEATGEAAHSRVHPTLSSARLDKPGRVDRESISASTTEPVSVRLAAATAGEASGKLLQVATAGLLELSDAELDRVTAGTLNIGDANTGTIRVSAPITRSSATNMVLTCDDDIVFDPGSLSTAGGTLLLNPAGNVRPVSAGVDATTSGAASAKIGSGALAITVDGTTVDSQHGQLNVAGLVDVTGVGLNVSTTSAYMPSPGSTFTIVNNDGVDPIIGTFNGLDEGDYVSANFLGSGNAASITYVGGDGNDAVIVVQNGMTDVTIAPVAFALEGVRPNPARGNGVQVAFALPTSAPARLELVDLLGRKVADREVGSLGAGRHTINLTDEKRVPPGLYWVRLTQGSDRRMTRVVVID